jgi:integrase
VSPKRAIPALTGIETRHRQGCRSRSGAACNCRPTYRAEVHDPQTGRPRKSPTFKTVAGARGWRASAQVALQAGTFSSGPQLTLRDVALDWLAKAEAGETNNISGRPYKPSVLRSYETSLRLHVLPILGAKKLGSVRRRDVQDLIERIALGRSPSTVRNAIMPLRAIYRRAYSRDLVSSNPTVGLTMPASEGVRDRIAGRDEAVELIELLPAPDRAVWATAIYAGLRLGELQALSWENVDFGAGVLRVEWSWDKKAGLVAPKSSAGRRTVPISGVLSDHLASHQALSDDCAGLVFGRSATRPFSDSAVRSRAKRIWTAAGRTPLGLHEGRHTYASLMIAAGINAKELATYMGHRSITTTMDRYGHLFPGSERAAADLLDAYLTGA